MNLKDCINIIKNCTMLACEYHIKDKCNYGYEVRENRFECAKEQAIKALEKQIPQKHHRTKVCEIIKDNIRLSICPVCLHCTYTTSFEYPKYCTWCGQKLDWS